MLQVRVAWKAVGFEELGPGREIWVDAVLGFMDRDRVPLGFIGDRSMADWSAAGAGLLEPACLSDVRIRRQTRFRARSAAPGPGHGPVALGDSGDRGASGPPMWVHSRTPDSTTLSPESQEPFHQPFQLDRRNPKNP